MKIVIPKMPMWEQIGGDMSPGQHGATIARSDGDALELLKIQPVRAHVGDGEAAEVGFPFWTREAYYDLSDLDPSKEDVQSALQMIGMSLDDLGEDPGDRKAAGERGYTPEQRALIIAEALLDYGVSDEGPAGWSSDILGDEVKWWSGEIAGADYLSDEDQEFRDEVLGHGEIKEKLEEAVQEMVDESAAQGWSHITDQLMIDLEDQGFDPQSIVAIAEFGDAVAVNEDIELEKTVAGIESELEPEGYELTDRGGDVPSTEGYAYAEHVIQRVAREMSLPQETIEEAAKALDWWQEEIPGSTSGYASVWAKKAP